MILEANYTIKALTNYCLSVSKKGVIFIINELKRLSVDIANNNDLEAKYQSWLLLEIAIKTHIEAIKSQNKPNCKIKLKPYEIIELYKLWMQDQFRCNYTNLIIRQMIHEYLKQHC